MRLFTTSKSLLRLVIVVVSVCSLINAAPNFQDDIRPIFKEHCLSCHNPDKKKADLDLTTVKAIQAGSSGGEVVKAGAPDTSILYMVVDHHEDFDPMPPKKPKIPEAQIKKLHEWIAGGLVESKGGKSQLRDITFDLSSGSKQKPKNPAIPKDLPKVEIPDWRYSPPAVSVASSPWADVVAKAAGEKILLYTKTPARSANLELSPVAVKDLVTRYQFDDQQLEGKLGKAIYLNHAPIEDKTIPHDFLPKTGAFTVSAWVKPDMDVQQAHIFGNDALNILIERTKNGWRTRGLSRDRQNGIVWNGRVGEFTSGSWQHITVTCDGREWIFYYNSVEIAKHLIPEKQLGFLNKGKPYFIGGSPHNRDSQYRGGLDDFRLYNRALSVSEVKKIFQNANPYLEQAGALDFANGTIHDLRFSPNGELLVAAGGVGGYSGSVAIYDVKTGKLITTIGDEQDSVLTADISSDHQYIAIGTVSKLIKIFSVKTGERLHRIEKHTNWVTAVRFSPDGTQLATGDRNGGIHTWETKTGGIVYTLDEHKVKITSLDWRSDGGVLASAGEDGKFVLWDMKDGWATRTASVHAEKTNDRYTRRTGILDIQFLRNGKFVTIGRDKTIKTWDTDGSPIITSTGLDSLPLSVAPAANQNQIYVGDLSGGLHIFEIGSLSRSGSL